MAYWWVSDWQKNITWFWATCDFGLEPFFFVLCKQFLIIFIALPFLKTLARASDPGLLTFLKFYAYQEYHSGFSETFSVWLLFWKTGIPYYPHFILKFDYISLKYTQKLVGSDIGCVFDHLSEFFKNDRPAFKHRPKGWISSIF